MTSAATPPAQQQEGLETFEHWYEQGEGKYIRSGESIKDFSQRCWNAAIRSLRPSPEQGKDNE
jgi:hypothetical protein